MPEKNPLYAHLAEGRALGCRCSSGPKAAFKTPPLMADLRPSRSLNRSSSLLESGRQLGYDYQPSWATGPHAPQTFLFDHLVGELLKLQWDIEAERLCSLEIYDQLEFGRLLNRQIGGYGPPDDFVGVHRSPPVEIV
jgi:hypothetical protein